MKQVVIYSDGGCHGNPGPGGWAAILRYGTQVREISGGTPLTTNNRMELQAAVEALKALRVPCEIEFFTDSKYLRDGITQWIKRWQAKGWRTVSGAPVKNDDLWRELSQMIGQHRITWKWVKGHAGQRENERCDQLAQWAIEKVKQQVPHRERAALRQAYQQQSSSRMASKPTPNKNS